MEISLVCMEKLTTATSHVQGEWRVSYAEGYMLTASIRFTQVHGFIINIDLHVQFQYYSRSRTKVKSIYAKKIFGVHRTTIELHDIINDYFR